MSSKEAQNELISRLRSGDEQAAADVYQRYAARLLSLARSRLSKSLARRLDAEDVVQSAYRSFFIRARDGEFAFDDADALWRLLAAIVLNKLHRQAKRHRAARRSIAREEVFRDEDLHESTGAFVDREPSVVDLVIAADELAWLMGELELNQQTAIELRLRGQPIDAIAEALGINERTVRRWLSLARDLLTDRQQRFDLAEPVRASPPPISVDALGERGLAVISPRDYVLKRLIASGGVSKVYAAERRSGGDLVCVKVMRKSMRGKSSLWEWFINEAALVAKLSHPRIVPIHGVGILPDGGLFLVMKLIDGVNLAERQKRGAVAVEESITIMKHIADAVAHAHAHGVLHCDLKPQNVLVDSAGGVWLTDFGFGQLLVAKEANRNENIIAGTRGFMAPEQLDPSLGPVGVWTDVYGLAAMLYVLVTGIPPDETKDVESTPLFLRRIFERAFAEPACERLDLRSFILELNLAAQNVRSE